MQIRFANHHFIGYFDSIEHINVVEKQADDDQYDKVPFGIMARFAVAHRFRII